MMDIVYALLERFPTFLFAASSHHLFPRRRSAAADGRRHSPPASLTAKCKITTMNDSIIVPALRDVWYGPSYQWFFWLEIVLGILISISNGLVIWIALSTKNIRSRLANWFVIGLAVADFVMGFDKVVLVPFAFTLAERYPIMCAIEGSIHCTSSIVTIAAPSMMAASRYYTVIRGVQSTSTNPFIEAIFFKKTGVISLIAGSWIFLLVMYGTLTGFDQMGMSIHGFCGTKPFNYLLLFLSCCCL
uniref:G-protein coupled receptors family 1 profile domain-containing protein n=1 Tax=Plectus sambesii TaxID=2011161 RepID=A0A914XDL2_9BILA